MVSSLSYKLNKPGLVTGFGARRAPPKGRGIIRNVASAGTRALGTYLVNRLADVIKGSGKRTVRKPKPAAGNGFKPTGYGVRRPRKTLTRKPRKVMF